MKKKLLLAFILASGWIQAQEKTEILMNFNHDGLSVKNLDQSAQFYLNVMQLTEITNRTKKEGIRWFSMGDGKELHLISTIKEPVQINKAVHIAFTISDFDSFIKKIESLKITYSDWPGTLHNISVRADGIKQIYIQDPDGYWIEINSSEIKQDESEAIKRVLEKESATWRSGDSAAHANCWSVQPYSQILISSIDGSTMKIEGENMIQPILNPSGGSSKNTNYKMSIHSDSAWVSHDEESIASDGKKTFSHEIRFLEKKEGQWKLIGQSIHVYKKE